MYSCMKVFLPHRKSLWECQKKCQHEWDANEAIFQHIKGLTNSKKREQPSVSFSGTPAEDQPAKSHKTKYQLSENKTKHRGKENINLSALFWRRQHVGREELWSVSLNSVKSRNAQNDELLCNVTNLWWTRHRGGWTPFTLRHVKMLHIAGESRWRRCGHWERL